MPYIPHERRVALDVIIDGLVKRLKELPDLKRGDLNYTVTRLVLETLNKDSYHSLSDCVSVLRDAADEIARRLLGPYEDTAIQKNGDMGCFQKPYSTKGATTCRCKGIEPTTSEFNRRVKEQKVEEDRWQGCHTRTNPCVEVEKNDDGIEFMGDVTVVPLEEVVDDLAEKVLEQKRQLQRQCQERFDDWYEDAVNGRR